MTMAQTRTEETASAALMRLFVRFVSAGYLLYLVLLIPAIGELGDHVDAWWTWLAVPLVFGTGILPGLLSVRDSTLGVARTVGGVAAVAYLVAAAAWPFAWDGTHLGPGHSVWLSAFPGVASLAAAMTWPAPLVFAHLVTACSAVIGINHVARGPDVPNPLLADIAFAVVFSAVFVVAAVVALRSGRILDLTRNRVYTAAGAAAAEDARLEERFRFDALTHDEVMATLLSAARFDTTAAVQSQASTALNKLDALRSSADDDAELDIESAIAYLRATITTIDPSSEIAAAAEGPGPTSTIPLDAVRTVSAAAAEAVRNSIRHAGADAVRRIEVTVGTTGGLDVRVIDDGIGFDPERVEPHRLGLAISIRERMRQLAGGYARVHSELGSGSVVEVGWKR